MLNFYESIYKPGPDISGIRRISNKDPNFSFSANMLDSTKFSLSLYVCVLINIIRGPDFYTSGWCKATASPYHQLCQYYFLKNWTPDLTNLKMAPSLPVKPKVLYYYLELNNWFSSVGHSCTFSNERLVVSHCQKQSINFVNFFTLNEYFFVFFFVPLMLLWSYA